VSDLWKGLLVGDVIYIKDINKIMKEIIEKLERLNKEFKDV